MELCPVCRYRDATCKIRLLRGQTFFSCRTCYEAEERKAPPRRYDPPDYGDVRESPLLDLREKPLPELLEEPQRGRR